MTRRKEEVLPPFFSFQSLSLLLLATTPRSHRTSLRQFDTRRGDFGKRDEGKARGAFFQGRGVWRRKICQLVGAGKRRCLRIPLLEKRPRAQSTQQEILSRKLPPQITVFLFLPTFLSRSSDRLKLLNVTTSLRLLVSSLGLLPSPLDAVFCDNNRLALSALSCHHRLHPLPCSLPSAPPPCAT